MATTSLDDNYFYIASNGIPAHNMMIGATAWIASSANPSSLHGRKFMVNTTKPEYAASPPVYGQNFMKAQLPSLQTVSLF